MRLMGDLLSRLGIHRDRLLLKGKPDDSKAETGHGGDTPDSHERYRMLVEMAQDGIWLLDRQFMTVYVNPKMEKMLGYTKKEMIGRSWHEFGDPQWAARTKELEKRLEDGANKPHEFLFIHKNGKKVLTRIAPTPLYDHDGNFDGAFGIVSDITSQKEADEAIKIKDMLNSIAKSTGFGFCILNPDYTIAWYDDMYTQLFGPLENTMGRNCFEVFEGKDSVCSGCPTRMVFKTGDVTVSERSSITTLNGTDKTVMVTALPIRDASGNVIQVIEIVQDVTEQKGNEQLRQHFSAQLEAEVSEKTKKLTETRKALMNMVAELTESRNMTQEMNSQLALRNEELAAANDEVQATSEELTATNEALVDANEQLQEVDRMKSDFLNTMSHELRTPLTAIIGYSSLLLQKIAGGLTEKQQNYADGIHRSGNHLLSLINEILDLSKIESGKMRINIEGVGVKGVVRDALVSERPQADAVHHRINVDVPDSIPSVAADYGRLKQVLINLISNAIKFTPDNGTIDVRAYLDGEYVRIDVNDSGIGIKDCDMPKLFRRFVQLDSRMSRQHAGTGLGLSIVDEFTKLMGGEVLFESEYGKGSTFSIRLPVYRGTGMHDSNNNQIVDGINNK